MDSVLVVVGLALVLGFQVAIHLRIDRIPALAAHRLKLEATDRGRAEMDALQERIAPRLNLLLREIKGYHDELATRASADIIDARQRAQRSQTWTTEAVGIVAELRALQGDASGMVAELRALLGELAGMSAELRTLQGDFAELVCSAAELRAGESPAPEAKPADEGDQRKTMEMPLPPASQAPPADEDEEPEELTQVLTTTGAPLRVPGRRPSPVPRPPAGPPPLNSDDDAPGRRSMLPPPPSAGREGTR